MVLVRRYLENQDSVTTSFKNTRDLITSARSNGAYPTVIIKSTGYTVVLMRVEFNRREREDERGGIDFKIRLEVYLMFTFNEYLLIDSGEMMQRVLYEDFLFYGG